jgi:hypothetical protein
LVITYAFVSAGREGRIVAFAVAPCRCGGQEGWTTQYGRNEGTQNGWNEIVKVGGVSAHPMFDIVI